ncbi:MAG: aspartate:alanine exchanger family transporter [Saprospiraceae bacterium]
MNTFITENPLLLLFLVISIGYLIGNIKVKGTGLGTTAVLFIGLAFGAMNPDFNVPDIIFQIGIVFFVYTVGLRSGPAFFDSFRKNGWRDITFVMLMLGLSAIVTIAIYYAMDFDKATIVGMYSGSSTNTTALAGVIDMVNLKEKGNPITINHLVVGYTFSYPMGVLGVMIAIKIMERFLKIDYQAEKEILRKDYPIDEDLTSRAIEITNHNISGKQIRDLIREHQWNIVFGRVDSKLHGTILSNWDITLYTGDKIIVVGTREELDEVEKILGKEAENSLTYDRKEYDIVRIFVSNPDVVGRELSSLNLQEKYSAIITRIRRGDIEMLAKGDTILELGDRIRFVARRQDIKGIQKIFGDSYYASSKIDLFSFGIGIALGLVLGMIEFNIPGRLVFKLGFAGGPLIVGLLLGALRRTGPIVWSLPYGSNVTLNQLGLTLLLAVIGIRSGNTLMESLSDGGWVKIFLAGSVLSVATAILSLWLGYKLIKIPYSLLLGFVANQPAILEFATDITKNRVPAIGYSFMFPISLVMKILFAQILYLILS